MNPNKFFSEGILHITPHETYLCDLRAYVYAENQDSICLRLIGSKDSGMYGDPVLTATKYLFAPYLKAMDIILESPRKMPELVETLYMAGIITRRKAAVEIHSGYNMYPVHALTQDAYIWVKSQLHLAEFGENARGH